MGIRRTAANAFFIIHPKAFSSRHASACEPPHRAGRRATPAAPVSLAACLAIGVLSAGAVSPSERAFERTGDSGGRPDPADASAVQAAIDAQGALSKTIERLAKSFVFVGGGSGVLVSPDGWFLTNHHVAGSSKRWLVRVGTKLHRAELAGTDPRGDVALLKIEGASGMPFVELGDSDAVKVGQQVIAIGNPFGLAAADGDPTVTLGIVSCLHRFNAGYSDAIQTDAAVNPGNSGGPLFTLDGKLIGINGQIATRFGQRSNTGIGLAIPSNQIARFLPLLKEAKGGVVFHGLIRGMRWKGDAEDSMQDGAEIAEVFPGSAAEKTGLKKGDVITAVEGVKILNPFRFNGVIGTYPAGTELALTVKRGGKFETLKAKLEKYDPADLGATIKRPAVPGLMPPVELEKVEKGLAADKAGLKPGDRLLAIDGKRADSIPALMALMANSQYLAGDKVKVRFKRGEEEKVAELTFSSAFANPTLMRGH